MRFLTISFLFLGLLNSQTRAAVPSDCTVVPPAIVALQSASARQGLAILQLACQATNTERSTEYLLPGTKAALASFAGVLSAGGRLDNQADLDKFLRLNMSQSARLLCESAEAKFRKLSGAAQNIDLTSACLRPKCLEENRTRNATEASECRGLNGLTADQFALVRLSFSKADTLAACARPKNSDPIAEDCKPAFDGDAVASSTAASVLRKFFQESITKNDDCNAESLKRASKTCADSLLNSITRKAMLFAEQSQLADIIDRLKSAQDAEATRLLTQLPILNSFRETWKSKVQAELSISKDDLLPFYLRENVSKRLEEAQPSYLESVTAVRNRIVSERLRLSSELKRMLDLNARALKDHAQQLRILSQEDEKRMHSSMALQRADDWLKLSGSLAGDDVTALIAGTREFAKDLQQFSGLLKLMLAKASDQIAIGNECATSDTLDQSKGVYTSCIKPTAALGIAGFRFVFVPCPSAEQQCSTEGRLEALSRVSVVDPKEIAQQPKLKLATVPTGINVSGQIKGNRFEMSFAPALPYKIDREQLSQTIGSLLSAPFQLELDPQAQIEVRNGPNISVRVRPKFAFPGIDRTPSFAFSFGRDGVTIDGAGLAGDLAAEVGSRIAKSLADKEVSYGGVGLKIDRATLPNSACGLDPSQSAGSLYATAKTPALPFQPKMRLAVSCSGQWSMQFDDVARLSQELITQLKGATGIKQLDVAIQGAIATVSIELGEKCFKSLQFDLTDSSGLAKLVQNAVSAVATCKAIQALEAAKKALPKIVLAGIPGLFTLQPDGKRACTPADSFVGLICLKSKVPLQSASADDVEIEDDGTFSKTVQDRLSVITRSAPVLKIQKNGNTYKIVCELSVSIPGGSQNIPLVIPLDGSKSAKDVALDSLKAAIDNSFSGSKMVSIGGLAVTFRNAKRDGDSISVVGGVSYAGIPGTVTVQLLPSFKVTAEPPDKGALLSLVSMVVRERAGINMVFDANGIPSVVYPVSVGAPLFGGATVTANTTITIAANGKLRLGSVGITLPYWIPIVWILEIGRLNFELDLDHLEDIAFGAAVAITPGEATGDIVRLEAQLRHLSAQHRVQLKADFILVGLNLAESDGYWDYRRGVIDVVTGAGGQGFLPLPKGRVVIDGPGCSIIGTASFSMLGARMESAAGVLLGDPCKPAPRPAIPEMAEKLKDCDRSSLGTLCMNGALSLGAIGATGQMSSRLGSFRPKIVASFDAAGISQIQANMNTARTRLTAKLLGMKMSVVLPNVETLNGELIEQLFRNLLNPSIDLEALLKGRFTVNPFSKAGKSDGSGADNAKEAENEEDDGDASGSNSQPTVPGNVPAPPDAPKPTPSQAPGSYLGPPGPCRLRSKSIGQDRYQVIESCPGQTEQDKFQLGFQAADANDIVAGRIVVQGLPTTLQDGRSFVLACAGWPCKYTQVVAVWVATPGSTKVLEKRSAIAVPSNDVIPPEATSLRFVSFIASLAKQQLSGNVGKATPLRMLCLGMFEKECVRSIANLNNPTSEDASEWSIASAWGSYQTVVLKTSFLYKLLVKTCGTENACNAEAKQNLLQWGDYWLLASGSAKPDSLPQIVLAHKRTEPNLSLLTLNERGVPTQKNKVEFVLPTAAKGTRFPGWLNSAENIVVPVCEQAGACRAKKLLLSPMVPLLDSITPLMNPASEVVLTFAGDFSSALVRSDKTSSVISALVTENLIRPGTQESISGACASTVAWADLIKLFNAPDRDLSIAPEWAGKLLGKDGDLQFIRDLVTPAVTANEYRILPLQFLPPHDLGKCVLEDR